MQELPLFPLTVPLLPKARMPLQIFEPRYLDLIKTSLREERPFGIIKLAAGREVELPGGVGGVELMELGTSAEIVDWDALPSGRLGVVLEGRRRFRLLRSWQQSDRLHVGEVEWLAEEPTLPLPEEHHSLVDLLEELLEHPFAQTLALQPKLDDAVEVANLLSQLLPISEEVRYQLLAMDQLSERLAVLQQLLEQLAE